MQKIGILVLWLYTTGLVYAEQGSVNPFAVNDGLIPSKAEYNGTFFKFNHNYPKTYHEAKDTPWHSILKKHIESF